MSNVFDLFKSRSVVGTWPPPPEYWQERERIAAAVDVLDVPPPHRRAIDRARRDYPGRAEEVRRLFRILDVGRRMDHTYRRRWSS